MTRDAAQARRSRLIARRGPMGSFAALRISPRGSDAAQAAQLRSQALAEDDNRADLLG